MQFKTKACQKIEKYLRKECVGCFFSTLRPYESFGFVQCDISVKQKKPNDCCKKFRYSDHRKNEIRRLLPECSPNERKNLKSLCTGLK